MGVKRVTTDKFTHEVGSLKMEVKITRPFGVDIDDLEEKLKVFFRQAEKDPRQRGLFEDEDKPGAGATVN